MKYTAGQQTIHPNEFDQAANSYLMAVVAVIAGLPLPIVNLIASFGYYMAKRKSSYFVRWHAIQAVLAQLVLVPFNALGWAWTLSVVLRTDLFGHWAEQGNEHYIYDGTPLPELFEGISYKYWLFISLILFINIFEFFAVIYTASRVRKGHNVRWFIIANIADALCSKEKRDIYNI